MQTGEVLRAVRRTAFCALRRVEQALVFVLSRHVPRSLWSTRAMLCVTGSWRAASRPRPSPAASLANDRAASRRNIGLARGSSSAPKRVRAPGRAPTSRAQSDPDKQSSKKPRELSRESAPLPQKARLYKVCSGAIPYLHCLFLPSTESVDTLP